jgi:intein/homing endonuclease
MFATMTGMGISGMTRIADPLSGRSAMLSDLARFSYGRDSGGVAVAPPVTAVLSLTPDHRLVPSPITGVYRGRMRQTYVVHSRSGAVTTATGNQAFLTPEGYRQLDDLAPGCEVAMRWSGEDIFWSPIAAIEPAGIEETFHITAEPHHNYVAEGFVLAG